MPLHLRVSVVVALGAVSAFGCSDSTDLALACPDCPPFLDGSVDARSDVAPAKDGASDDAASDALGDGPTVDADEADAASTCNVVFTASFQSGKIPAPPLGLDMVANDSLTVVPAPWNVNQKALRVLVRKGEDWNGQGYPRSEIHPGSTTPVVGRFQFGQRYTIKTAFWFDQGTVFPTKNAKYGGSPGEVAIFQLHGDDGSSPVLAGQVQNGVLQVGFLPDYGSTWQTFNYGACPVGQRMPVEVVYQPSTGKDGYLKVTIGSKKVVEISGPNHTGLRKGNATGGYWKQGIYDYWRSVGGAGVSDATQLVVFNDDLTMCKP